MKFDLFSHPGDRESVEQALGFPLPPYRLPYEQFRTDYGIGVIGLHWVVQSLHLPAYRAARFTVIGAAEVDPVRTSQVQARDYPIGYYTTDYRELLRDERVQIIDSSFGHGFGEKEQRKLQLVRETAAAGKSILVHKPAASSLAVAEEMERIASETGVCVGVNQNCRYNPAAFTMKQLLTPERLGTPRILELQHFWTGSIRHRHPHGPAWMQHVIHHCDLLRWWAGSDCLSVYCRARERANLTIYEFANGAIAYHHENHSGHDRHQNRVRIQAENGVIEGALNWNWHLPASTAQDDRVEVYRHPHTPKVRLPLPIWLYEPPWSEANKWIPHTGPYFDLGAPVAGMMGCMGSMMRALHEEQAPDNHISGALKSLRMALAAEISAKTGLPVNPATEVPPDFVSQTELLD